MKGVFSYFNAFRNKTQVWLKAGYSSDCGV